mgnify:CR=1 FL=1
MSFDESTLHNHQGKEIIFDEKLRNKLSNSGKKYIDGKGIERLLKKIL